MHNEQYILMDDPEGDPKADIPSADVPIPSQSLTIIGTVSRVAYPETSAIGPLQASPVRNTRLVGAENHLATTGQLGAGSGTYAALMITSRVSMTSLIVRCIELTAPPGKGTYSHATLNRAFPRSRP
jgi:hypothetical protein